MEELIEAFSIERVGKSGSRFDPEKAKWFNHQYLIRKSDEELADLFSPILKEKGIETSIETIIRIISLVKERVAFVHELWDQSYFFFIRPEDYDPKAVKKRWKTDSYEHISRIKELLADIDDFSSENIEKIVKAWIEENELGMGAVMNALRLVIVGALKGPHLFSIIELIGKNETLARIENGLKVLGKKETG